MSLSHAASPSRARLKISVCFFAVRSVAHSHTFSQSTFLGLPTNMWTLLSELLHASVPFGTKDSKSSGHMFASRATEGVWCFLQASQLPLWAILSSLPVIESVAPSSAPTIDPSLMSIATQIPPDVCFRSCCVSCKSLSTLGFFVELLLHFFLPQSVLYLEEDIALSFVSSHVFSLYSKPIH